ncbi:MAG: response regulator, partial [Acidimicrobiales bacterium]
PSRCCFGFFGRVAHGRGGAADGGLMRVVVCDDDPVLRSVAATLAEQAGHEVLAETDSGGDAIAMVERFGAELLVLDLALPGISGYDVLVELRRRELDCDVVVFTAFDTDTDAVIAAGARAVVMKPDLAALDAALAVVPAAGLPTGRERRRPEPRPNRLRRPPVAEVGPSGVAPPALVDEWLATLRTGDAVLALAVDHPDVRPLTAWGRLRNADRLLAAARTANRVLRAQDRVGLHEPDIALAGGDGLLVCLLLGGGRAGPPASFARLASAHLSVDPLASLRGGWVAVGDGDDPRSASLRAIGAVSVAATAPTEAYRLFAG